MKSLTAWLLVIGTVLAIALVDWGADRIVNAFDAFMRLF